MSNSNPLFPLTFVLFLSLDFKIGTLGDFIPTCIRYIDFLMQTGCSIGVDFETRTMD